jgi:hypothetical protein
MSPDIEQRRIPDLKLEQFLLGELDPKETRRIERELERDPALQERVKELRRSNEEILERYPADDMAAAIRRRLQRPKAAVVTRERKKPGFWPIPALSAAAAAIVALLILIPPGGWFKDDPVVPTETRIKGLEPQLLLFRKAEKGSEQLETGAPADEGDLILIQYVAAGAGYGVIFSLDGGGALTRHAPLEGLEPMKLQQEGPVSLDFSYELDDAPRWEKFYFVTSDAVFDFQEVLSAQDSSWLTRGDSLLLPPRIHQTIFTLEKEASHE